MVWAVCFAASVAHATLQDDVDQAVSIIERFEEIPESAIPLGGNLSAAIGPIGRSAEAGVAPQAAIYTYSRSQGISAGISPEARSSRPAMKRTKNFTASRFFRLISSRAV
jgi:lipid-binding SYLF domain-containing protein